MRRLPDPAEAIGTAIVKYNYQAQQPDELPLTKGTRILILEKSNDGFVAYFVNVFLKKPPHLRWTQFTDGGEVRAVALLVGSLVIIRKKK